MEEGLTGILIGPLYAGGGECYMAIDVLDRRVVLSLSASEVLFQQIGGLLQSLGYFDEGGDMDLTEDKSAWH